MVCLSRPYHVKSFKGCLPQNVLSQLLNTFSQIYKFLSRRIFTAHFHEVFQIGTLENDFSETYLAHYQTFTKIVAQKKFFINV